MEYLQLLRNKSPLCWPGGRKIVKKSLPERKNRKFCAYRGVGGF